MSQKISIFLEFGYIPETRNRIISQTDNRRERNINPCVALMKGVKMINDLKKDIRKKADSESKHVVPLSSGLDSRLLLALLLDNVENEQICTVTFGIPGVWDFELGKQIARDSHVSNKAVDLQRINLSADFLISCAQDSKRPTRLFERAINVFAWEEVSNKDAVHWSGFFGDPPAGAHLPKKPVEDWDEALHYFVRYNRFTSRLTPDNFCAKSVLPSSPVTTGLEFAEQLDYAIRQPCFIGPTVLHSESKTPFLDNKWISFWLSVPRQMRVGRKLFKQVVLRAYPDLFTLPTDANYGLSLTAPEWKKKLYKISEATKKRLSRLAGWDYTHPATNYLNFESAFRDRMFDLAASQLNDLKRRNVVGWLDIDDIWSAHQAGEDYADEIRILVSLEIYLKEGRFFTE